MAELKVKTHTTYTYETTDGREFKLEYEALAWQEHLENIKGVVMLDHKFCNTNKTSEAYFIHIKTQEQLDAFEAISAGLPSGLDAIGYWYYDEDTDTYISVQKEMDRLQSIIESLDVLGK